MFEIDTSTPVMVTGATGYVAGRIIERLLQAGATVHAAVRDPSSAKKLEHLDAIAGDTPGTIEYFAADLLENGSYDAAMAGCRIVFHTASPFINVVADPQRDLVDPALDGTRNVLEGANRTPSVERVVLTSSCAAIYGDTADRPKDPGGAFTEDDWNETSSLQHQPYSYSKTVAEKEAWAIARAQDRWDLVVINPSLVVGPGINPRATSESFNILASFGNGKAKMGVPDLYIGMVDVRDVAQAHLAAAYTPGAKGRHITSGHDAGFMEIARILAKKFPQYPLPRRTVVKPLLWLVGPFVDKALTRRFVARNVGYPLRLDNAKSKRELGLRYRPLDESLHEMFQQMIDAGTLEKR